ncbi:MAG: TIGR02270 family protein [Pseudomonadota bacterium]
MAQTQLKNDVPTVKNTIVNAYQDIYDQYVVEASFLWLLRSIAIEQPHYNKQEILELENRVEAQLDGLLTAPDDAWQACLTALELEEPGEVFTATVVAFKSHDMDKISKAVKVGLSNGDAEKGLISALGWLPGNLVHSWIKKFFTSKDLNHKYLALCACSIRRENPSDYLNRILDRDDCKENIKLYARALRIIGELRRQDLMQYLTDALVHDNEEIKFWAIWSLILLGHHQQVSQLESYVLSENPNQKHAINIAFRVLPIEQAREWISKLSNIKSQTRTVIQATGILGDPHAVNWLILKMKEMVNARLAAQSFYFITGIDLVSNGLIGEDKNHLISQPDDLEGDNDLSLDEDENLPWPDYEKVSAMWMNCGNRFVAGQRYFLGQAISADTLKNNIRNGNQRQIHAAALELALTHSEMPMQNTRARVIMQGGQ